MKPRLIEARHVRGFVLHLRFSDGVEGDVDFSNELDGEVFQALTDIEFFKRFTLDPHLRTLVWPNGADFAPEFLRDRVLVSA